MIDSRQSTNAARIADIWAYTNDADWWAKYDEYAVPAIEKESSAFLAKGVR